jgi:hypothetical protein
MGLNVFNGEAVRFWQGQGLTDVTASMELTINEARKLMTKISGAVKQSNADGARLRDGVTDSNDVSFTGDVNVNIDVPEATVIPIGLPAYGKLPLMLLRRCPFNRQCKPNCPGQLTDRTNRAFPILCHGDYHELLNADTLWLADKLNELNGFAFLSIFLHKESPQEARAVVDAYVQNGGLMSKTQAKSVEPPRNFTRGLLYRGVE